MKTLYVAKLVPVTRLMRGRNGFALVVSLTLLVLLTVVGVGVLSLATIQLRNTSQGDAASLARANARLALMLALGEMQKWVGPDARVTMAADQRSAGDGSQTSAAAGHRYWTGVYRSWPSTSVARPAPVFQGWLVSGETAMVRNAASADSVPSEQEVLLVGSGSALGNPEVWVRVPKMAIATSRGRGGNVAWWVGDQGIKAAASTPVSATDASLASRRLTLQGAPRNAVELATTAQAKPFAAMTSDDVRWLHLTDWSQAALVASEAKAPRGLFHDLTATSSGLLTNVRAGGFRKDLSMQLERPSTNPPTTALYTVGGESGINLQELWVYYQLYREVKRSGGMNYTTGGRVPAQGPYLQIEPTAESCQLDDEFFLKQPVILSYQLVLSFRTLPVVVAGVTVNRLHVVADPVLTFWNPLDVPVVLPAGMVLTVKYWQVPYDLFLSKNGGPDEKFPLAAIFSNSTTTEDGDANFLSLQVGGLQQFVFKPGEVIKFSQSGNLIARSSVPDLHKLAGKAGFNYGSGVAMPVRDLSGRFCDLLPTDFFTYRASANALTAGKTSLDGNSPTGKIQHTRHFSLTHHEYYVGEDRGSSATSLGIGNMAIDWDFGNRRLQATENRGTEQPGVPGTKPSSARLYADRFPEVFRPIEKRDGRELSAAEVGATKAPFLLISYQAKTEKGSVLGTRSLARFNPRALHVDFYDLTPSERDLLPYEFVIEPLTSWKNRSLEVSPNGAAYFGGGVNAEDGSSAVTLYTVPREPLISLAAFQHAAANGFNQLRPKYGYATLNAREPMLPQISHAIGNSMACSGLAPDKTEGTLSGGRPYADHSYLANQALWDDWFLSGITPQMSGTYAKSRTQRMVATEFFTGKAKLPTVRYVPELRGADANRLAATYFASSVPSEVATRDLASYLRVEGAFNVNSTSVEAWKCVLSGLKGLPVVVRDLNGGESTSATDAAVIPVSSLMTPWSGVLKSGSSILPKEPEQWAGRRVLDEEDISSLAKAMVREVRRRGPFLSLGDFVNRRVGREVELARCGAVQAALDAPDCTINAGFRARSVSSAVCSRFPFGDAESGPMSYGAPGVVKQADVLTPIAPILSARSDTFLIRAYGEAIDSGGRVTARAWCEASVQRVADFVDSRDVAERSISSISSLNQVFGRRFRVVSFRWLHPDEI